MKYKKILGLSIIFFSLVVSAGVRSESYFITVKNNTPARIKAWIGNAKFTAPAGQGTSLQPILEPGAEANLTLTDGYCAAVKVFLQEYLPASQRFDAGVYLSLPIQEDRDGHACRSFKFSINKTSLGTLSVE